MEQTEKRPICVLYVEDNSNDFLLVQRFLNQLSEEVGKKGFDLVSVDRVSKALERLAQGGIDLILTDLNLPDAHELEAVSKLREHFPWIPIIALTSAYTQTLGPEAIKKGAQDYLLKDELDSHTIKHSIQYAIERKRLEKMKDEFVSTVAHELKAPLTVISGGIVILQMGDSGPITSKQNEILEMMTRNTTRLVHIINNLLDLSRLESGHFKINRRAINLKPLIHEAYINFQKGKVEKHIVIEEDVSDFSDVFVDPDLIMQVLNNLLSNALRYAKTRIVITAQLVDHMIQVSVMDDGPGISEEDQKKLFLKFVQLDQVEEKQGFKGTGLGLALSKEIIKQHQGEIWMESRVGQGSQFYFTVPLI